MRQSNVVLNRSPIRGWRVAVGALVLGAGLGGPWLVAETTTFWTANLNHDGTIGFVCVLREQPLELGARRHRAESLEHIVPFEACAASQRRWAGAGHSHLTGSRRIRPVGDQLSRFVVGGDGVSEWAGVGLKRIYRRVGSLFHDGGRHPPRMDAAGRRDFRVRAPGRAWCCSLVSPLCPSALRSVRTSWLSPGTAA